MIADTASWKYCKVKDTMIQIIDGDRGKAYPKESEYTETGYCLFLTANNVSKRGFRLATNIFISKERDNKLGKGKLQLHDIVLTTRGTVGNIALYDESIPYECVRINSGMVILRTEQRQIISQYLYTIFGSAYVTKQINRISYGSAQPQLTVQTVNDIVIPIPPVSTQRKIVSIVDTWDRAIDNIDKLISAKQKLKQALMQKLLTGQVRISGIGKLALKTKGTTEGWAVHKLGEICSIVVGKTPSRHNSKFWDATKSTDNMWITISDMQTDKISDSKEYVSNIAIKQCRMKLVEAGTMIVSFKLSIGKIGFLGRNGYTNEAIAALTPKTDAVDMSYLSVILPEVFSGLDSSIAIKGKTLNQEKMKAASIVLPSIIEQIKVSKILTTYSKEIKILMRIKYHYQTEKLWLSQKLFDVL